MEQPVEIDGELLDQRAVEPELGAELLIDFRRGLGGADQVERRVARRHADQDEVDDADRQHHRDELKQSADAVAQKAGSHRGSFFRRPSAGYQISDASSRFCTLPIARVTTLDHFADWV